MTDLPGRVAEFLKEKTIAVVGVSRDKNQPANTIFRKLRSCGYKVYAVNPNTENVEGEKCYPDIDTLPEKAGAAVIVTRPDMTASAVKQCIDSGIGQIWIHRSFGKGSVSEEAIEECIKSEVNCLIGGCPMMYCEPVDFGHKCMRWILKLQNRVPA